MGVVKRIRRSRAAKAVQSRARQYVRDDTLYEAVGRLETLAERLDRRISGLQDELREKDVAVHALLEGAIARIASDFARDLEGVRAGVAEADVGLAQLHNLLRREAGLLPPPPKELQKRVVGAYVPSFFESGFSNCRDLERILSAHGKRLADFPRVLDWGCGSGRVSRALHSLLPDAHLSGTDIDPAAIGWLRENCGSVADFRVAPHRPPTTYTAASFDLVIGISVLTHLPEEMQFEWLEELARITSPGGYLVLTTSGETNFRGHPPALQARIRAKGFHYVDDVNYGRSVQLPDFYQNTYHTIDYIRREWSKYLDIVDVLPAAVQMHQDAVLARRRG